jgi:SAM-dependent methyltransferase
MDPSAYPLHADVENRHWWFRGRRRIIGRVAASLGLGPEARLLEFGSGTGGNLGLLNGFGVVTAVELDDGARELSSRLYPTVTHARTLEALPADARFDAAFMLDVLEHLDDPVAILRQLKTRLAPRSPLVLTVPAHGWLFGQHDRYLHHRRRYSRALLRQHLLAGGFTVEHLTSMNAALFPAVVGARLAEAALSLVKGPSDAPRGMGVPAKPINAFLTELFAVESRLVPRRSLPFGVSLLAIAR